MRISRSAVRSLGVVAMLMVMMSLTGCEFLLNEAFVYNVPPPVPVEPTGVDAAW